jgi:hypothetical protein
LVSKVNIEDTICWVKMMNMEKLELPLIEVNAINETAAQCIGYLDGWSGSSYQNPFTKTAIPSCSHAKEYQTGYFTGKIERATMGVDEQVSGIYHDQVWS